MSASDRKRVVPISSAPGESLPAIAARAAEERLIARARRRDPNAFAALVKAHQGRVFSLCLTLTHNPATAEDLTQEAFMQLFRKISTFRGESAFRTWFHRMVLNVVLMSLRRKRLPIQSLEELESPTDNAIPHPCLEVHDPQLDGVVDRITLRRALARLAPGYRNILLLHDLEGYDHQEIAEMLHCSPGTTKSQLHKARRKLRELLGAPSTPARESRTRLELQGECAA